MGQRVDAYCQALPQSGTASLAGGTLYQCELRLFGANAIDPGGSVNKYVEARGPLFINPAYALETPKPTDGVARSGARTATVMGGGLVTTDRPLQLRLRTPQWNIARAIEQVINTRFQGLADKNRQDGRGMCVAEAQDEGYLNLYVPVSYKGNWEHFAGVGDPPLHQPQSQQRSVKAQDLATAARQPGAMLEDISFALEGLGNVAIPYITPLLTHPSPDVRYAAARAGACLGDTASEDTLITIARNRRRPLPPQRDSSPWANCRTTPRSTARWRPASTPTNRACGSGPTRFLPPTTTPPFSRHHQRHLRARHDRFQGPAAHLRHAKR